MRVHECSSRAVTTACALLVLCACTRQRLVTVRDRCGTRCVAAPLLGCATRGKTLQGKGPVAAEAASPATAVTPLEKIRVAQLVFEEMGLREVAVYLRTVTGLNVVLAPALGDRIDQIHVTLTLEDVNVKQLLDLLTEPFELIWTVRDGVIRIGLPGGVDGAEDG